MFVTFLSVSFHFLKVAMFEEIFGVAVLSVAAVEVKGDCLLMW